MRASAHDIILAPIVTENSLSQMSQRKYTFKVAKDATKISIAKAVVELFGVEISKVNTISVRGQLRRQGKSQGYTASYKKAIVTLTPKSKGIEFFESMV